MPGPRGWFGVIEQLALPVPSVSPVTQVCWVTPEPSFMVSVRPAIGTVPSSFSTPLNVVGTAFAMTVGPV